ncbi:MAG: putative Fe-S oxidoreductase [Parcubacteria group bacterium Gr01-1014_70]|nr:MAG: putative Fe-S oxidoreductase [Parcubacteria group bacterium Gr01-1014_70]
MTMEVFEKIISDLSPYKEKVEMMDLFGLGEPFLDPLMPKRIRHAKKHGFRNVGFSSNMALFNMSREKQREILESGIDTIIFSIDGATAPTYEAIRINGRLEKTVANCLQMITLRNEGNYKTRFLVRFVKQKANEHEEQMFTDFWEKHIDRERRDFLGILPAHSWGSLEIDVSRNDTLEKEACPFPFQVMYILADGQVTYCCEDWSEGKYNFGNVKDNNTIVIFNGPQFKAVRTLHLEGKKNNLPMCRNCTVPYTERDRRYW